MAKANIGETLRAPFEFLVKYPVIGIPPLISAFVSLLITLILVRGGMFMNGFKMFALSIVEWIVVLVMQGWLVSMMDDMLSSRKVDIRDSWLKITGSLGNLLIVGLIVSILTTIGIILFVIPGIIVLVTFSVAVSALIKKNLGVVDSLKESINFVYYQGNFWVILLIVVIGVLLAFVPYIGAVLSSFLTSLWIPYAYLKYSE